MTYAPAPFAGKLVKHLVQAGDIVAPHQPLVEIENSQGEVVSVALPIGGKVYRLFLEPGDDLHARQPFLVFESAQDAQGREVPATHEPPPLRLLNLDPGRCRVCGRRRVV